MTLAEVLMLYTTKTESCWLWKPKSRTNNYGVLEHKGKRILAHRASFSVFVRPLQDGELVRHTCDNPPCIRPDHLVAGTHADNMRDAMERRRTAVGSRSGKAKLTEEQVIRIRKEREAGALYSHLCEQYGISPGTLSHIINRKTWRHV